MQQSQPFPLLQSNGAAVAAVATVDGGDDGSTVKDGVDENGMGKFILVLIVDDDNINDINDDGDDSDGEAPALPPPVINNANPWNFGFGSHLD